MTEISWSNPGTRLFELGVDRGVLYVGDEPGVPWSGLISINETPSGGDVREYYLDGIKYLNYVTLEDFAATIQAYTYPAEFEKCDGTAEVKNGLFVNQQRKVPFNLAYRTTVGNDIDGTAFAYKLHLVYNAWASPSDRNFDTINEQASPLTFNWTISTKPAALTGFKPSAHFVVQSDKTPAELLANIERILYGSSSTDSRMPEAKELVDMFNYYLPAAFYDSGYYYSEITDFIDGGRAHTTIDYILDAGSPKPS